MYYYIKIDTMQHKQTNQTTVMEQITAGPIEPENFRIEYALEFCREFHKKYGNMEVRYAPTSFIVLSLHAHLYKATSQNNDSQNDANQNEAASLKTRQFYECLIEQNKDLTSLLSDIPNNPHSIACSALGVVDYEEEDDAFCAWWTCPHSASKKTDHLDMQLSRATIKTLVTVLYQRCLIAINAFIVHKKRSETTFVWEFDTDIFEALKDYTKCLETYLS